MHKALVTGGTRGIGRAIAEAIVADGGRVVVTGRSASAAEDAAAALAATVGDPQRAIGLALDVRDRANVERVVAESSDRLGGLNVLINNAGIGVFRNVAEMTDDDWDRVIGTNLTGVFYCTRAALPELRKAGGAWIVNIASLAGRNYFATAGAYCASKAGLVAFSEAVMLEERERDVRVSVIMPGSVATEFSHPSASTEAGAQGAPAIKEAGVQGAPAIKEAGVQGAPAIKEAGVQGAPAIKKAGVQGAPAIKKDDSWKLKPSDVAQVVMDLLHARSQSLPSKIEIRPTRTK